MFNLARENLENFSLSGPSEICKRLIGGSETLEVVATILKNWCFLLEDDKPLVK